MGPSGSRLLQNGVRGVEPDANTFKSGFRSFAPSLITIHFRISRGKRKYAQECLKEMGLIVLKVTMSPRYMWKTRSRSAVAKMYSDERRTV